MEYRFTLEPYSGPGSRYQCPNCKHRRETFARYIDNETGEYLADHAGICDRADKCGYHYPPRDFFSDNPNWRPAAAGLPRQKRQPKPILEMPWDYVNKSLKQYQSNNFVQFLVRMFGDKTAMELARKYRIGTSKRWPGATVFWQIDIDFRVRAGKIMLYNPNDCKRVKAPVDHITWVHKVLQMDVQMLPCFFGEHLLGLNENKTVCIAESEKTAVLASIYYPNYVWLAAGALTWLTVEKCKVLEGRDVWLYPDVNGFALWKDKAKELNARMPSASFRTDKTLELWATDEDRENGADMADYWINEFLSQTKS